VPLAAVERTRIVLHQADGLEEDAVIGEEDAVEALQLFPSKLKTSCAVR
tara:strand:- start:160 stop:306 length:147 start_codon:yes stop_codon:yes gene_type:complete